MTQLPILFPTPMTEAQLAAAYRLSEIVERTRCSFECEQFRRHREAGKKGWAMRLRRRSGVPGGTEPVSRLGLSAPAAIAGDA